MAPANGVASAKKDIVQLDVTPKSSTATPGDARKMKGSWLCEKGPYLEYIDAMCGSNPGLERPDPMNQKNHPLTKSNALVVLLEKDVTESEFTEYGFKNSAELRKHFGNITSKPKRRIYLMEGLATEYIDVIGSHFFMDPSFFLRQERTCVWSNDFTPTSDALSQPSLLTPESNFHLQYCELRQFSNVVSHEPFFCKRTGRHVGMTPARDKEKSTTCILRRKIGWWCRPTEGDGWDVVLLCDPQLHDLLSIDGKTTLYGDTIKNHPFQGGYVDFLPPPNPERALSKPQHPHQSMLKDLCHYFLHHSDLIDPAKWSDPTTSALFLKKILAAHHLQLVDYIKAMLPSLELRLTTAWVKEQNQWKSLQTISRRCGNYSDDIEDTLLSLGYSVQELKTNRKHDWTDCEKDFQYIYFRLKILKSRADTLMQAMTGLASIAGNRQNLEEAKRVKRLNLLALLFIPLAYTSSLFSMQDNYAPNKGRFWVYWVTAMLVVSLTFGVTYVMDKALDDAAQWKYPRQFKLWGKGEPGEPGDTKVTRKKTGFFD